MQKIILLSLFGLLSSKILLHETLGLSLEKRENLYIHRKNAVEANVLVPLSVHIPEGPYQSEAMARVQTNIGKVLDHEGLQFYHKNNTEETYSCDQFREYECQTSWFKAGNGKSKSFLFFLLILQLSQNFSSFRRIFLQFIIHVYKVTTHAV